jgi:hypothetical protein
MSVLASITLYDHCAELLDLLEESELAGPEHRAEFDQLISMQIGNTREKVDRVSAALGQLDAAEEACTAEIQRLQTRKQSIMRAADRLKNYVLDVMQSTGLRKLEGRTSGLAMRCNAPSVEVIEETSIPPAFFDVTEVSRLDKRRLKAAVANGEFVPGVRLVQTLSLVRR